MKEFGAALSRADEVVLTDIYAAGEPPIPGVTLESLASVVRAAARGGVHVVPVLEEVPAAIAMMARPGDLVITLGAGSIGGTGERILEAIRHRRPQLATPADRPVEHPVNRREGR
jgi:UDP-N-acetylmuramate--alanine ligase